MIIPTNRPFATDKRLLPVYAAAELARKKQEQCREDEGGRTIARPVPPPVGDPPR